VGAAGGKVKDARGWEPGVVQSAGLGDGLPIVSSKFNLHTESWHAVNST